MSLFYEKFQDKTPFIPGAGVSTNPFPNTVDHSIRQDLYFTPSTSTPEEIKKYRDSTHQRVGVKQLHPGIYSDPKFYEDLTHGMKSRPSDHVPDCIKGANIDGNKFFMNQLAESHYASKKREPLGKSLKRDYIFPEEVKNEQFKFGIPTRGLMNAKELIYNGAPLKESDEVKKLYYKTHGVTDPGEQSLRGFKFNVDPNEHKFGFFQEKERDGVKKSLGSDFLYNPYPQTKLVGKRLEDYRQATEDMLGKSKFMGTLAPKFYDNDHTFGKSSNYKDWNASKCIHGDIYNNTSQSNVEPDIDLGRDVHWKNKLKNLQPSQRDKNRVYGVPSIRNDLPKKELKSVTDIKNYGDEQDAYELLYPHPEHNLGVDDKDFEELMTKEEIYELIQKYDFNIPEDEYNLIYQVGLKNYPNDEGKMSPKSFIGTMRNLKREYQKYRNIVNNPC